MQGFFRIPARLHMGFILMTELAKSGGYVSLREVGARMHVSDGYLEEIAAALKSANLIQGRSGPGGGYRLVRDPKEINAEQIVTAIEGPMDLVECHGGACPMEHRCSSKRLWDVLQKDLHASLKKKTLAEFV